MKYLKIFGLLCIFAAISFVIINFYSPRLNGDKGQDLVIDFNKRFDSLQTKIEEGHILYAKLDSAEKAFDSVNIKMQEFQKENELLQWRVDSMKKAQKFDGSINSSQQEIENEQSLTQAIAEKNFLILQQSEGIRQDRLEMDSTAKLYQKEISKNNPEQKAM